MQYFLQCKNEKRALLDILRNDVRVLKVYGLGPLRSSGVSLEDWVTSRTILIHNKTLRKWLQKNGKDTVESVISLTHSVSINDCFWIQSVDENLTWEDVSPYTNELNDLLCQAAIDCDLQGLSLNSISPEPSIEGSFPKCCRRRNGSLFLYKRGGETFGSKGREPYCEVLASKVYSALKAGIPYKLEKLHGNTVSVCKLFTTEDWSYGAYYKIRKEKYRYTDVISEFDSISNGETIRRILVADAITCNVDRHSGNFGVLYNSISHDILTAAPGFDYNLALMSQMEFEDLDFLREEAGYTQSYSRDLFYDMAVNSMTSAIREDLLKLKGIQLTLPWYDNRFTEEYASWLTDIVNERIDNILAKTGSSTIYKNIQRYQEITHTQGDKWVSEQLRLMRELNVSTLDALNEAIVKLLPTSERV